jgi:hypothetical protein
MRTPLREFGHGVKRSGRTGGCHLATVRRLGAAPGSYEDILDGSFDYVLLPQDKALDFFPEGFADG